MSPKHDTAKVRIHSSTKRSGKREFKQHCVRWYEGGKRKQRCFTTLAEAKTFKLEVERNPGGVWVSFEFKQSTVNKLEEMAKRDGLSVGEVLRKAVQWGSESGFFQRLKDQHDAQENAKPSSVAPEKERPVPRGMRVVIQSLGTGQRLMMDRKGVLFVQSTGEEPKPLPFPASWVAFTEIFLNHDGQESGEALRDYLDAVTIRLSKGEAK